MNTPWYEILMIAMLAVSFYAGALDLLATFRKLRAPVRTEKPIESVSPPVVATTHASQPSPSVVEGTYRESSLRPSAPDYDESLKGSKPRPFVPGQTVLVRLHDDGKKLENGPLFTAIFMAFKRNGYSYALLKVGDEEPAVFLLQSITLLHPEDSTT